MPVAKDLKSNIAYEISRGSTYEQIAQKLNITTVEVNRIGKHIYCTGSFPRKPLSSSIALDGRGCKMEMMTAGETSEFEVQEVKVNASNIDNIKSAILEELGTSGETQKQIQDEKNKKECVAKLSWEHATQSPVSSVVDKLVQVKHIDEPYLECGLVNDRHEMPVKLYIFNEALSEDLMFDYEAQEEHIKSFIDSHIPKNEDGKYEKEIMLYATGLQTALAALIKVCSQLQINMTVKHWNAKTGHYNDQAIFKNFNSVSDEKARLFPFKKLLGNIEELYFYDCSADELDTEKFYLLKQTTFIDLIENMNSRNNIKSIKYIVSRDFDSVWEPYEYMAKANMKSKELTGISVFEMGIDGSALKFCGSPILKMFNFKK